MKYEDIVRYWKGLNIDSRAKLELALDNYRILFAYHSGKLENDAVDYHDTREIFTNGRVNNYTGDLRALFEQRNQRACYFFLLGHIIEKRPLDTELVLEVHRVLTEGTYDEHTYIENDERPGAFKKHDYVVGISDTGYPPEEVAEGVSDLLDEINNAGSDDILTIATYFHAKFEFIHPFADGNGRTGRTLLNYLFMINDFPPTVIYAEEKLRYSVALEAYDATETIDPLKEIIVEGAIKAWSPRIK